jgi:hypothetical protein
MNSLRHYWARFALAALAICPCLTWIGCQQSLVSERTKLRLEVAKRGGLVALDSITTDLPIARKLLGDQRVASVTLVPGSFAQHDRIVIQQLFPEAKVRELEVFDPVPMSPDRSGGGFFEPATPTNRP